ncbi:MAG: UvrD-helicase domain-containing protein [Candidatus Adiutrix sp.]|jgi:ATP-dependent helicase/nuclease subunit A|nr:UvrD-helicase domain-containing protein [Candidatus Adiutrix sp.]
MGRFTPNKSQLAVIECRDKLCVIAGAGSGKTGALVETLTRRLSRERTGDNPLSATDLLALTFTEKAAAELRQRLGEAFRGMRREDPGGEAFWRRESARLDRADIGTIHGYALRLIRENALTLGLPAGLNIEDGGRAFRDDLENITVDWLEAGEPDFLGLCEVFSRRELYDLLAACARRLASWGLKNFSADLSAPAEGLRPLLDDFRLRVREAADFLKGGGLKPEAAYYERVSRAAASLAASTDASADELEEAIDDNLRRWSQLLQEGGDWHIKPGRQMRRAMLEALEAVSSFRSLVLARPVKERLLRLTGRLPGLLAARKKRRGAVDFDDILILARRLLATRPEIRRREIERRRLVLVDEFQDTNRLQANLLAYLLLDPGDDAVYAEDQDLWSAMDWSAAAPRLIVFGDLKQSIYRFRGAEVQVMASLRDKFSGGGGAVLPLEVNYRSQGPLVDFFNVFFADDLGGLFTSGDRQTPARAALYQGPHVAIVSDSGAAPSLAADRAEAQARLMVRHLADLFSGRLGVMVEGAEGPRPPVPGDVAVLFRRFKYAGLFKEACLAAGWKCQTAVGGNSFDYAEVKAVLAAFRHLGGFDEEASLAGLLRSPLGPVSDGTLLALTCPDGGGRAALSEYFRGARPWPDFLPDDDLAALLALKELLDRLRPLAGRLRPVEMLEMIIEERGLIPLAMLEKDGAHRVRALQGFLALSRAVGRGLEDSPLSEAEELTELWRERESAAGSVDMETLDAEAVKILTVHAAKGLEFPVVLVAEADRLQRPRGGALAISDDGRMAVRFRGLQREDVRPPDYEDISKKNEERSAEEEKRLFYVAATRARDHLALLGWPKEPAKRAGAGGLSWLEAVCRQPRAAAMAARVVYDAAGPAAAAAAVSGAEGSARPASLPPRGFLSPLPLAAQTLAVTSLSRFLADPEAFRKERHLGLAHGFAWSPGGKGGFFESAPASAGAAEAARPPRALKAAGDWPGLSASAAGTLFHAVLEKIDLSRPDAGGLLREEARRLELPLSAPAEEALAAKLRAFLNGPLGREWKAAGESQYRELPFWLRLPGPEPTARLTLTGIIDLFYISPEGRGRIVDYKLARFSGGPELEAYERQLMIYAQAVRTAGFAGPLAACLYFAGGEAPARHEVKLEAAEPMRPIFRRLYELWPLLEAARPPRPGRPGPPLERAVLS